jgi:hypothetical protein
MRGYSERARRRFLVIRSTQPASGASSLAASISRSSVAAAIGIVSVRQDRGDGRLALTVAGVPQWT